MFLINCKGRIVDVTKPVVMGIINVTPDSFFTESSITSLDAIVQKAQDMMSAGATFIDIGGQTTKPGSSSIGAEEEIKRVVPAIKAILAQIPDALISIDTYHAAVAKVAIEAGACMVNDVSGGLLDDAMLNTVASLQVPYVCMHMQGNPINMQQNPVYQNVTEDIVTYFIERLAACKNAGIVDVVLDPGFGFGKTTAHNYKLLRELHCLAILNKPILVGLSRKSMLYKTLNTTPALALNATSIANTLALQNGAHILRVHDVTEAVECLKIYAAYQK